ncbi:hypothetical protein [Smaragdicoccus niigatensis]|uniref:hypothetical protein n=1 Tax=Smaragdicoccus niigatensis TaxID=359359 RepID=UPI00035C17A9|nr:hypothetical protein [Smaragdicoccus niigatensis]
MSTVTKNGTPDDLAVRRSLRAQPNALDVTRLAEVPDDELAARRHDSLNSERQEKPEARRFYVGDRVIHDRYGWGSVEEAAAYRGVASVVVRFDRGGGRNRFTTWAPELHTSARVLGFASSRIP